MHLQEALRSQVKSSIFLFLMFPSIRSILTEVFSCLLRCVEARKLCTGDALMRRGQCGGCKSVLNEPIWRKQNKAKEEKENID